MVLNFLNKVKKNELIKTKTDLLQKKFDFGRKGNNWLEPLRNWIKTAYYAKKIALSKDPAYVDMSGVFGGKN